MDREKKSRPGSPTGEHVDKKLKLSPTKIKLSIGETVIVANKQTLMEVSPFFASLFRFHDDDLAVVSLVPPENADLDSFLAMLNSLTNTRVELIITAENLLDCIVLSEFLQVKEIEKKCWKAFRKILPTLTMDELLRLWRHGHACDIKKAMTLTLAGISFNMDTASKSTEFLDLSPDELVALMSDDEFVPLMKKNVCEAVRAWCEHDLDNRKNNVEVMNRVLAEVVWDDSTRHLIQSISPHCQEPSKMPKRTVINSADYAFPDDKLLKEVQGSVGIVIGNFLYFLRDGGSDMEISGDWNYDAQVKAFHRMDMNTKDEEELRWIDFEKLMLQFDPEDGPEAVELAESGLTMDLCHVKLAGCDKIGFFGSNRQLLRCMEDHPDIYNVTNVIALYDIATDKWQDLPCLPLPRTDCTMIQCGCFLYVIGGSEHKAMDGDGKSARHCFRLNLTKFTDDEEEEDDGWERIADLS